jgi:hypothetical protein
VPSYREALAVFERLARIDPSDANAARTVAIGREKLGHAVREAGNRAEAMAMLEAALATHRDLVAMDAGNVRASCDLARVAEAVGDLRAQSGAARGASLSCELWRESERARDTHKGRCGQADVEALSAKLRSCGS